MQETKMRARKEARAAELEDAERKYRAPALEKGLDVLELMAARGAPMTLSQISTALDRSVSELFRMVQALEYKGYIVSSASGEGYSLTNKLFALGMAQAPIKTLVEAALPAMRRLAKASVQSCHLAVPSDDQIAVVTRVEAPGDLGFSVRVGYRRPVLDATSGVVLYAFQPAPLQEEWLARLSIGSAKKRVAHFLSRVEEVRAQGFARARSDFVEGVVDISAPIMGAYRASNAAPVT
jgi:DNA-binding IclR family transcriptional regulator